MQSRNVIESFLKALENYIPVTCEWCKQGTCWRHAVMEVDIPMTIKPVINAEYIGPWDFPEQGRVIQMWTLLEDIPGHPIHSTVSDKTIKEAGYSLPNIHVDRKARP